MGGDASDIDEEVKEIPSDRTRTSESERLPRSTEKEPCAVVGVCCAFFFNLRISLASKCERTTATDESSEHRGELNGHKFLLLLVTNRLWLDQ